MDGLPDRAHLLRRLGRDGALRPVATLPCELESDCADVGLCLPGTLAAGLLLGRVMSTWPPAVAPSPPFS